VYLSSEIFAKTTILHTSHVDRFTLTILSDVFFIYLRIFPERGRCSSFPGQLPRSSHPRSATGNV